MNVNVYLPDDLGKRAKEAELPLSRLLRDAVVDELERRTAVSETLTDPEVFELSVEDDDGRHYMGRITGKLIAYNERENVAVYLTDDERVIIHEEGKLKYWVSDDPVENLRHWLEPAEYADAMHAIGEKPIIDL